MVRVCILQEVLDLDGYVWGYLYRHIEMSVVPHPELSIQLPDGYMCMPSHIVYDVKDDVVYIFDFVKCLYTGHSKFIDFLSEFRSQGWTFKEDVYEPDTMRIVVSPQV